MKTWIVEESDVFPRTHQVGKESIEKSMDGRHTELDSCLKNLHNIHGETAVRENDTSFSCSFGRNTTEEIINLLDFPTAILCIRDLVYRMCV